MSTRHATQCGVCDTLPPGDLIELDLILGDPLRWPKTIWNGFSPPAGGLPPTYRKYGAERMGDEWLKAHGYEISKMALMRHFERDVPLQVVDVDELVSRGLIALAKPSTNLAKVPEPIDPLQYITFYNEGIKIGIKALGLLSERVQALIDKGEEVPLPLIKMMMDAGLKLAGSQAAIKAAGKPFGTVVDEDDAFRGGDDISPRFGSYRVREIDGEQRPVFDEGLPDRTRYNEQAEQEGGARIGGR